MTVLFGLAVLFGTLKREVGGVVSGMASGVAPSLFEKRFCA
jgi:hypothetical protein